MAGKTPDGRPGGRDDLAAAQSPVFDSYFSALQRMHPALGATNITILAAQRPIWLPPITGPPMAPRVSLCLIVRDEEAVLPTCLASTADLFDEVIVVDTGSTDRSKEIAAGFGAKVVEFDWVDSFAAARNESLRHATGEWIFYLDADEYLDDANRRKFRSLIDNLDGQNVAYVLHQRSTVKTDRVSRTLLDRVCLFRNRPEHRWRLRVHEQIVPALAATGTAFVRADITIEHTGYQDPAHSRRKAERYLHLLQLDNADLPDHPFILFKLCTTYCVLGRAADALPLFGRVRRQPKPVEHLLPWLYVLEANCLRQLARPDEALAVLQEGCARFPGDGTLRFEEAELHRAQGDLARAEDCLRRLLDGTPKSADGNEPPRCPGPTREGLRGYWGRHHLALVLAEAGRPVEAEAEWRAALADQPDFAPAASQLGELLLAQERWHDLEDVAAMLDGACGEPADAVVLRARACLRRGEFDEARRIAEDGIARFPETVWPLVVLTQALLQLGVEDAAEAALREVLRLDPYQAESWRNLAKLLRNQNRFAEAVALCNDAREFYPDEPDLLRVQGLSLQDMNRPAEAVAFLVRYLKLQAVTGGVSAQVAAVRYQLGRAYRAVGRPDDAEAQWQALLAEDPSFTAPWLELGNLYLDRQSWPELERVAARLETDFQLAEEAALLRENLPGRQDADINGPRAPARQ
jgi:tetratricopeptide (TPR) repeat protein